MCPSRLGALHLAGDRLIFRPRMMMNDDAWKLEFRRIWERGVAAWKAGRKSARTMFAPADVALLASIGCTAQELFDFVDDSLG
jgi:hypothetical protein